MRTLRRLPVVAVAITACLTGCHPHPQPRAPTVLAPAPDTIRLPYATATRAVWLGGRRWAVLAPNDGAVVLVDFAAGSASRLGGDRDTILSHPAALFRTADTIYVGDWGHRLVTLWTLDGRLARSISTSSFLQGALPHDRDGAGRFYVELGPPLPTGTAAGGQDSGVVVRTGAVLSRGDTVARLAPPDLAEVNSDQGQRLERRVFSGNDIWEALADGSVWVARVRHNRVDWRSPSGEWTKGEPLPDRVLEVTRYDRERFIRNFPPELRSTAQELPFAPLKPPFEDAFTAADGMVWLVKSRARVDSAGRVHVVNRGGGLLRDLRVPGQGRTIGASGDAAVVAEPTSNGIRLLRFLLPPLAPETTHAP